MIRANIVYPNACSGTTIHCASCRGTIPVGMRNDDDDAKRDKEPGKLPSFATVPPPGGVVDQYSAPTTVAELPDSFLDELKAATKHEAALRAKGRDLQTTQRNQSFDLELREQLTARLVGAGAEAPAADEEPANAPAGLLAPSPEPAPAPASSPAVEAVAAPEALDVPSAPPLRAPVPADGVSVFSMVVLALVAVAAIVWTFMTTLR
jgi:hypothetical protein